MSVRNLHSDNRSKKVALDLKGVPLRPTNLLPAFLSPSGMHDWRISLLVALVVAASPLRGFAENPDLAAARTEVHFAFSKSMFVGVNENDAKVAVKVYAQAIGDQNGIYVDSEPVLLEGTNAIAKALALKQADLFALTAEEFFALENQGLEGPVMLSRIKQTFTEDYLLLAREDNMLRKVEDLKGRSLIISSDARASLAFIWLEVLCRGHGLGPAAQVTTKVTSASKTTQVVLPVFFGKADACLVTRNGWEVMCELNPQLKKQLRIVAVSPRVVPSLTCFRHGYTETVKQQIIKAVDFASAKPGYKQLMALFKTDHLGNAPLAALESTRQLITTYHQLCAGTNDAKASALEPGISTNATEGKEK
jgi:phosphonate transport system substrate-binding protein